MGYEFLESLVIIFGISILVVLLLNKLKIPSLVGFVLVGIIIGPYGIGLIKDSKSIDMFAELGIVLLLFTIGIEFSKSKLIRMKKIVVFGGGLQVLLTIAVTAVVSYFVSKNVNESIFFGFLVALSSTVIIFKILGERGEADSPAGHIMIGMLIFQDICIVPLMLLTSALSGNGINYVEVLIKLVIAVLIIALVFLSARWVVPGFLHQIVRTKNRELFIISVIFLCVGITLLTSHFGLSLALGAFLAGIVIAESEYAYQAISDILPFKDSFVGLFFVSIGMLINIEYISHNYITIIIAVILIFGVKFLTGTLAALLIGNPPRTSVNAGLGLSHIGEFSFVLAIAGKQAGLISLEFYQIFLAASVLTMVITPFILRAAFPLSTWLSMHRLLGTSGEGDLSGVSFHNRQDHVIIIGFGLNGRNLARVLRNGGIPYVVLEINSDIVKEMKGREPIYYGDGTSKELLYKLGIKGARLLVVAISDPTSARRVVSIARNENPELFIIVRTRYVSEISDLKKIGANEVIPEDFETSIEILSRVLFKYNFPNTLVLDMIEIIKRDSYTDLQGLEFLKWFTADKSEWHPEIEFEGYKIPEGSHLKNKSISDLKIRERTEVTVIAIRRGKEVFTSPAPDFKFEIGDTIIFTGEKDSMDEALKYFVSVDV